MQPEDFNLMKIDGEWKVIREEQRVKLSVYDKDSEAVAKMMMHMDPKTLEQLRAEPRFPQRDSAGLRRVESPCRQMIGAACLSNPPVPKNFAAPSGATALKPPPFSRGATS